MKVNNCKLILILTLMLCSFGARAQDTQADVTKNPLVEISFSNQASAGEPYGVTTNVISNDGGGGYKKFNISASWNATVHVPIGSYFCILENHSWWPIIAYYNDRFKVIGNVKNNIVLYGSMYKSWLNAPSNYPGLQYLGFVNWYGDNDRDLIEQCQTGHY
jgi:hypothetical protein